MINIKKRIGLMLEEYKELKSISPNITSYKTNNVIFLIVQSSEGLNNTLKIRKFYLKEDNMHREEKINHKTTIDITTIRIIDKTQTTITNQFTIENQNKNLFKKLSQQQISPFKKQQQKQALIKLTLLFISFRMLLIKL